MSYLTERVAYLRGLAEGLSIDNSTDEGKLLIAMLDVIEEMADELNLVDEKQNEFVDLIAEVAELNEDDEDEDDLDYFEIQCEKCGNKIYLDDDLLDTEEAIKCPVCGEEIEIEFTDCCDDDCNCDNCH